MLYIASIPVDGRDARPTRAQGAAPTCSGGPDSGLRTPAPGLLPRRSWRFAAVAAALVISVAAGLWAVRPKAPAAGTASAASATAASRSRQVAKAPGDDTVVFWLDDETPVLVGLAEER